MFNVNTLKVRFLIFILIFVNYSGSVIAQQLSFDFYDSGGKKYSSQSFNEQLKREFKTPFNGKLILLLTAKTSDSNYQKQKAILKNVDAESLQLIYVNGCKSEEITDSYYVAKKTAEELMGESNKFLIYIIDSNGKVKLKAY